MKRIIKFIESENIYLRPFSSEMDAEICQVGKNDENDLKQNSNYKKQNFHFATFSGVAVSPPAIWIWPYDDINPPVQNP